MSLYPEIEELKLLSNEELRKKFKTSKNDTYILKSALRGYGTVSNNSLTTREIADIENKTESYVSQQRSILIKYGLIEPKVKNTQGNIKKLTVQRHEGKVDHRYVIFNIAELKAANLEPEKDYFAVVETADRAFTVRIFDTRGEAKKYKASPKQSQT